MSRWTRGVALVLLLSGCSGSEVPIDSPATGDDASACRELVEALPDTLDGQLRRPVDPEDALGAAWGDPAIVLTCGVADDIPPTATCAEVDGVGWWAPEESSEDLTADAVMTTIGVTPVVRLEIPSRYRPPDAELAELAAPVKRHLAVTEGCL